MRELETTPYTDKLYCVPSQQGLYLEDMIAWIPTSAQSKESLTFNAFVECLCRLCFCHLNIYGTSLQQLAPSKQKMLWMLAMMEARLPPDSWAISPQGYIWLYTVSSKLLPSGTKSKIFLGDSKVPASCESLSDLAFLQEVYVDTRVSLLGRC